MDNIVNMPGRLYRRIRKGLSRSFKYLNWRFRLLSANYRVLPDFIIIGAMKSGTTSLYSYLGQHPKVRLSNKKEIRFFNGNFGKGLRWYRSHFPLGFTKHKSCITGEATPAYMLNPFVAKRIFNLLPSVKIVAILRDPTDRAISHYYHEIAYGRETLDFETAIKLENNRIGPPKKRKQYANFDYVHFSYRERGLYHEQLIRYKRIFPSKNMLLVDFNALKEDPAGTVTTVLKFLGINDDFLLPCQAPRNVGIEKDEVPAKIIKDLDDYFSPLNQQLFTEFSFDPVWRNKRRLV